MIFNSPTWTNRLTRWALVGGPIVAGYGLLVVMLGVAPETTHLGYQPEQPVPFSHKLHAGQLKMDCRYCHNTVESAAHAAIPPTKTCINCHSPADGNGNVELTAVHAGSPKLAGIHDSWADDTPFFGNVSTISLTSCSSITQPHVTRGVACVSCHGRIDQMEEVTQVKTLGMGWCLECHRNPEPYLRPPELVTDMSWEPPVDDVDLGEAIRDHWNIKLKPELFDMSLLIDNPDRDHYWRSLNELAGNDAFRDWMQREFPAAASQLPSQVSRRRWLQLMGASLAFGGMTGCRWQTEKFAPLTVRPQNRVPGERQSFATCWELDGVARPLNVTSIDGRPIKIEGNREHPDSRGGTDAFDQALILSLYDPDRSDGIVERTRTGLQSRSWSEFERMLGRRVETHRKADGRGLAILCSSSSSLTRKQLEADILDRLPKALWCVHSTTGSSSGSEIAFGEHVREQVDLRQAKVIACFDADPLGVGSDAARSIRDWADRRDPQADWMNRLYAFESNLTLTGSNADHRVSVRSSEIELLLADLEQRLLDGERDCTRTDSSRECVLNALVDDLLNHRGESVLIVGRHQPADVHARVHRINQSLGNSPQVVSYRPDLVAGQGVPFSVLVKAMEAGEVETLLVLDANPAYGTALAKRFREALASVGQSIHIGIYRDETGLLCHWHAPLAHPLESWGDARTYPGTVTVAQPLIAPLFDGRSAIEILSILSLDGPESGQDLLRRALSSAVNIKDEKSWRRQFTMGTWQIPHCPRLMSHSSKISTRSSQWGLRRPLAVKRRHQISKS